MSNNTVQDRSFVDYLKEVDHEEDPALSVEDDDEDDLLPASQVFLDTSTTHSSDDRLFMEPDDYEPRSTQPSSLAAAAAAAATTASMIQPNPPAIPHNYSMGTEPKSFVNGLLSPFSPLFKQTPSPEGQQSNKEEFLPYASLQPCRKVSVVVRVLDLDGAKDDGDQGEDEEQPTMDGTETRNRKKQKNPRSANVMEQRKDYQQCVFPHVKTTASSTTSAGQQQNKSPRDLVIVKPTAFGKYIPTQVTMETARLVAQVAHISSEDWARLYEFHHVLWPRSMQPTTAKDGSVLTDTSSSPSSDDATLATLSRAVAQDCLVEQESSVLISLGQEPTCLGGSFQTISGSKQRQQEQLLYMIMTELLDLMQDKHVATISVLELVDDGKFRDVLDRTNDSNIQIRHIDNQGAIVQGLTQVHLEEMPALWETIISRNRQRFQAYQNKKKSFNSNNNNNHTSMIATISLWEHAVSHQLDKQPAATITLVELASSSFSSMSQGTLYTQQPSTVVQRKSVVSLGRALRLLLLADSIPNLHPNDAAAAVANMPISYRETNLTKILQRSLEKSQIVLLASISARSYDYEHTLATLNFLRRLLVKPGKTATSPFRIDRASTTWQEEDHVVNDGDNNAKDHQQQDPNQPSSPSLQDYAATSEEASEDILRQVVCDPRQRLAKIFDSVEKNSRKTQSPPPLDLAPSRDDYQPVDYMQDLGPSAMTASISDNLHPVVKNKDLDYVSPLRPLNQHASPLDMDKIKIRTPKQPISTTPPVATTQTNQYYSYPDGPDWNDQGPKRKVRTENDEEKYQAPQGVRDVFYPNPSEEQPPTPNKKDDQWLQKSYGVELEMNEEEHAYVPQDEDGEDVSKHPKHEIRQNLVDVQEHPTPKDYTRWQEQEYPQLGKEEDLRHTRIHEDIFDVEHPVTSRDHHRHQTTDKGLWQDDSLPNEITGPNPLHDHYVEYNHDQGNEESPLKKYLENNPALRDSLQIDEEVHSDYLRSPKELLEVLPLEHESNASDLDNDKNDNHDDDADYAERLKSDLSKSEDLQRNSSNWLDELEDEDGGEEEGDDLDLEPQTKYDLPDVPRPTMNHTLPTTYSDNPLRGQEYSHSHEVKPSPSQRIPISHHSTPQQSFSSPPRSNVIRGKDPSPQLNIVNIRSAFSPPANLNRKQDGSYSNRPYASASPLLS